MKYLMSVAWQILPSINVKEILDVLEKNENKKYVDGIEIATTDYEAMEYCLRYMMKNNKIFCLHCPKYMNDVELKKYLDNANKLAKIYGKKINIVFHSIEQENLKNSISKTIEYIDDILKYINNNNYELIVSLENLNYHEDIKRINMSLIDNVLKEFNDIYFTYDIGHDIYDNIKFSKFTTIQKEKLNNIHIHNIKNNEDHHVIKSNCESILELQKFMKYLKDIKFDGTIIKEEAIDRFSGDNLKEQLNSYIDSFKVIDDLLKNNK